MGILALILTLTGAVTVDGDTLKHDGRSYRVWGIDAPELAEPGGAAATRSMRALIGGQRLACTVLDVDRYGREVVQCFLPDCSDIACIMVAMDHAEDWPRYSGGFYGGC